MKISANVPTASATTLVMKIALRRAHRREHRANTSRRDRTARRRRTRGRPSKMAGSGIEPGATPGAYPRRGGGDRDRDRASHRITRTGGALRRALGRHADVDRAVPSRRPDRLAHMNHRDPYAVLVAGTVLHVPGRTHSAPARATYTVQWGDTLSAIAARYHIGLGSLARANDLRPRGLLISGTTLRIPGHARAHARPPRHHSRTHVRRRTGAGWRGRYRVHRGDTLTAIGSGSASACTASPAQTAFASTPCSSRGRGCASRRTRARRLHRLPRPHAGALVGRLVDRPLERPLRRRRAPRPGHRLAGVGLEPLRRLGRRRMGRHAGHARDVVVRRGRRDRGADHPHARRRHPGRSGVPAPSAGRIRRERARWRSPPTTRARARRGCSASCRSASRTSPTCWRCERAFSGRTPWGQAPTGPGPGGLAETLASGTAVSGRETEGHGPLVSLNEKP